MVGCILNRDELSLSISGERTSIASSINWSATPQGVRYWHKKARGKVPLSREDILFFKFLLCAPCSECFLTDKVSRMMGLDGDQGEVIE